MCDVATNDSMFTELPEQAVHYYMNGYNCAQSVFCAGAPHFGMPLEQAFRLACGLGGGIGHMGDTCGVITGAALLLGLRYSRGIPGDTQNKEQVYALVQQFVERFKQMHKTHLCRELKLSVSAEQATQEELALQRAQCARYVEDAARVLTEML